MSLKRIFVVLLQVVKSILQGKLLMRLGAEKWFPHFLYVFLNLGHFLLIAKDADNIISCHDAQFGEKRFEHLQVTIVDAVEHYRVNVF